MKARTVSLDCFDPERPIAVIALDRPAIREVLTFVEGWSDLRRDLDVRWFKALLEEAEGRILANTAAHAANLRRTARDLEAQAAKIEARIP